MAILFGVLLVGCEGLQPRGTTVTYTGGDGSSCQQSIVVKDARVREAGELGERLWLENRYPGYRETKQVSVESDSRHYDLIEFATTDGEIRTVYFDASEFFEK
jgi:hypothetical protein